MRKLHKAASFCIKEPVNKSIYRYFKEYLKITPLSLALWRTLEAEGMKGVEMVSPVLDIGCGFGEFAGVYFEGMVEVGIDINKKDLILASRKKKYKDLIYADARHLPFEDNTFSTIVSNSTLEHIKQAKKVFPEIKRLLKKGGTCIISVPTSKLNDNLLVPRIFRSVGLDYFAQVYIDIYHKVFKHEVIVSKKVWERYILNAGLKIVYSKNIMSRSQLEIFEKYLIFSIPTQLTQKIFRRRVLFDNQFRVDYLYNNYKKYLVDETNDDINVVFVIKK